MGEKKACVTKKKRMYARNPDIESESEYSDEDAMAIQEHIKPNMFTHYLTLPIDIEVVASPVELQRNPSKCRWKFQPHLSKEFKQNLAMTNRSQAGAENLVGNLDRLLPLGFEVKMHGNTFPYAMGIDIPGLMSRNLHKSGMCAHRVPTGTQMQKADMHIFDPESKVSRHMYENYRMCTMEDLDEDITFHKANPGKHDAHATIAVGSLAYETLAESLQKGCWQEEGLSRQQIAEVFSPGERYTVQVTEKMGKDVRERLRPEVERMANSFISVNNLSVNIHRADGVEGFATPKQIAGAINSAAAGKNTATKINMDALNRNCVFYIKGELKYLLF